MPRPVSGLVFTIVINSGISRSGLMRHILCFHPMSGWYALNSMSLRLRSSSTRWIGYGRGSASLACLGSLVRLGLTAPISTPTVAQHELDKRNDKKKG